MVLDVQRIRAVTPGRPRPVHGALIPERREREIQARDAAFRGGPTSTAFELAKLADLHDRGVITDAEFAQRKEKIQG